MTTPDDYIGFRSRAREAQERASKIRDQLEEEDSSWAELMVTIGTAHQQTMETRKAFDEVALDDARPDDERQRAAIGTLEMDNAGWAQINALMISKLGRELSQTHQKLANVEKELRDLRAALK